MPRFQIFHRHVYGLPKIYPANAIARQFATLLNVKTFTERQVTQIQGLGFHVEVVLDPVTQASAA